MHTWSIALSAFLGLVMGPVFHHFGVRAAVRAPFDGSLPRCETCEQVFSVGNWFGRACQHCDSPRRRREPWIWLLTAVGAGGVAWVTGFTALLPAHLALIGYTSVLIVTDLDEYLLPNRVLYPGTIVSVLLLATGALLTDSLAHFGRGLALGVGYMVVLGGFSLLAPKGFGLGDAKMALMLGTFAGFWGFGGFTTMLLATALLGGLPAWFLILTRRAKRTDHLPYGPAMIIGTWLAIVIEGRLVFLV